MIKLKKFQDGRVTKLTEKGARTEFERIYGRVPSSAGDRVKLLHIQNNPSKYTNKAYVVEITGEKQPMTYSDQQLLRGDYDSQVPNASKQIAKHPKYNNPELIRKEVIRGQGIESVDDPITGALSGGIGTGVAKMGAKALSKSGLKTIGKETISEMTSGISDVVPKIKDAVSDFSFKVIDKLPQNLKEKLIKLKLDNDENIFSKNIFNISNELHQGKTPKNLKTLKDEYPDIYDRLHSVEGKKRRFDLQGEESENMDIRFTDSKTTGSHIDLRRFGKMFQRNGHDIDLISLNPNFPKELKEGVLEHEIAHAVQNKKYNNEYVEDMVSVDKDLKKLRIDVDKLIKGFNDIPKLKDSKLKTPFIERINYVKSFEDLDKDISNSSIYFDKGSNGKEKHPFVAELRTYMKNEGIIPHIFDSKTQKYYQITPEEVQKGIETYEKKKNYPLRIATFIKNSSENYNLLADAMNKMPGVVLPVAGGILAKKQSEQQELKLQQGGGITKQNITNGNLNPKQIQDFIQLHKINKQKHDLGGILSTVGQIGGMLGQSGRDMGNLGNILQQGSGIVSQINSMNTNKTQPDAGKELIINGKKYVQVGQKGMEIKYSNQLYKPKHSKGGINLSKSIETESYTDSDLPYIIKNTNKMTKLNDKIVRDDEIKLIKKAQKGLKTNELEEFVNRGKNSYKMDENLIKSIRKDLTKVMYKENLDKDSDKIKLLFRLALNSKSGVHFDEEKDRAKYNELYTKVLETPNDSIKGRYGADVDSLLDDIGIYRAGMGYPTFNPLLEK